MKGSFCWELFNELPIVGILRSFNSQAVQKIVEVSAQAGLANIEITMNSADAAELIYLARQVAGDDINVGAGTVCTIAELDSALAAGAEFIVTPVCRENVIRRCRAERVAVFPGAMTPTEVYQAWSFGADMVKIFPANQFGPDYIKAIKGPLSQIKLMPTGGVSAENIGDYIRCGADGFGVGGTMFDKDRIANEDWSWLTQQVRSFVDAYKNC